MFGSGIMIDSRDAVRDKADLSGGRNYLTEVKNDLVHVRAMIASDWKGDAAIRCDELLEGFIRQIDGFIGGTQAATRMLNAIVDTYRDADRALASKM